MKPIVFRCTRCGIHLVNEPAGQCILCQEILNTQSRPTCAELSIRYKGVA